MTAIIPTRTLGGVGTGIPLSAVIEEQHASTLNITRNPIETGADVVDHAHVEPKSLTLKAVIDQQPARGGFVGGIPQGDTSWYNQLSTPEAFSRLRSAYESLVQLQEKREPFDIQTGLFLYANMLIESLDCVRDKNNAFILEFTAKCLEVKFASTGSVSSSGGAPGSGVTGPNNPSTQPPNNQGQVPGQPVKDQSFLDWMTSMHRPGGPTFAVFGPGGVTVVT